MNELVKPYCDLPSLICLKEIGFYIIVTYFLVCKYRDYF